MYLMIYYRILMVRGISMTRERYTPRQIEIIEGKIPDSEIITAEYTRILKWAKEVGDEDVAKIIQPLRDNRTRIRKANEKKDAQKYTSRHYDRIVFTVPKGVREKLKDFAAKNNISVNGLILQAIEQYTGIAKK